jgi:hypothetical protein
LSEQKQVGAGECKAGGVKIKQAIEGQVRRRDSAQHLPVVPAEMSNRRIEWSEEPLVGRRKDNDSTSDLKPRSRIRQFCSVVFDVLKNIDVKNSVEPQV